MRDLHRISADTALDKAEPCSLTWQSFADIVQKAQLGSVSHLCKPVEGELVIERRDMIYHAQCSCGAVQIEAEGEPVVQCYCHCNTCRSKTGSPVNAPVLWPKPKVRFKAGEDKLRRYSNKGHPEGGLFSCGDCNGLVGVYLAEAGLFDIFAGLLSDLDFAPTVHINYENAVLPIKDGLPKLKDMPADWGGSGEFLPE